MLGVRLAVECCADGRLEELERRLRAGAVVDVNLPDEDGCTGLHLAIGQRNRQVVALLVRHGADFTIKDQLGYSAIHWAVLAGESHTLDLVERYVDATEEADHEGFLPIHLAIVHQQRRSLEWLLARGVGVDAQDGDGYTALHHCALADLVDMARRLVDAGARADLLNDRGETVLAVARRSGSVTMIGALSHVLCPSNR